MKKYLILGVSILICCTYINAQSVELSLISSAGGYFQTSNESLTFTVGEVVTETFSQNDLILTQGFLQVQGLGTYIPEIANEYFSVNVYPNPVQNSFNIDISDSEEINQFNNYKLTIIDIGGKIIHQEDIFQPSTKINISHYRPGTYFIKLNGIKKNNNKVEIIQKI